MMFLTRILSFPPALLPRIKNLHEAHWPEEIYNTTGKAIYTHETNKVLFAQGYRQPMCEYFHILYAKAYESWLEGDTATEDNVYLRCYHDVSFQRALERFTETHGAKAMLREHEAAVSRGKPRPRWTEERPVGQQ